VSSTFWQLWVQISLTNNTGENIQSFETSALLSFFLLSFGIVKYKSTSKIHRHWNHYCFVSKSNIMWAMTAIEELNKIQKIWTVIIKEPRKPSTFPHWEFAKPISLSHYSGKNTSKNSLIDETPIESLVVFYSLCLKRLQFCTQIEQTMLKLKTIVCVPLRSQERRWPANCNFKKHPKKNIFLLPEIN